MIPVTLNLELKNDTNFSIENGQIQKVLTEGILGNLNACVGDLKGNRELNGNDIVMDELFDWLTFFRKKKRFGYSDYVSEGEEEEETVFSEEDTDVDTVEDTDDFMKFLDVVQDTEIYREKLGDKRKVWFTESWFYEI
jgi:hypothetical protein